MKKTISFKLSTRPIVGVGLLAVTMVALSLPAVSQAQVLYRQLQVEMTGADVSSLQTFLAKDVTLYPQGLVTGYYGFLTKAAVSNFQSRNGLDPVGRVGPMTLPVINAQMAGGGSTTVNAPGNSAPMITGVSTSISRNNATINWNTNQSSQAAMYYSTNPLVFNENLKSVVVSGNTVMTDSNFRTNHSISLQNLLANTTYYYMVYNTNQIGNVSVTWPATFQTTN